MSDAVRRATTALAAFAIAMVSLPLVAAPAEATQPGRPGVWGWGDASVQQLGDGSISRHYEPSGATQVPDTFADFYDSSGTVISPPVFHTTVAAQLAAGTDNVVMRTTTGDVFTWGGNANGESYGNNAVDASSTPIRPTYMNLPGSFGGRRATSVTTSAQGTSYALLNPGGWLVGWGSNINSLLGDGTTTRRAPILITQGVLQVGCGSDSCLAIKNDAGGNPVLWGWGSGSNGTFGEGGGASHTTPTLLSTSIPGAVQVAAGNRSTAVLDNTGAVHTMGANLEGELGNGTTTSSASPVTVAFPGGTHITSISAGQFVYYAIDDTGGLWSWGYGGAGSIGDGTNANRTSPVRVTLDTNGATLPTFTKATGGFRHALALATNGDVYAWGDDGQSQLGRGEQASSLRPVKVTLPRPASDIAATASGTTGSSLAILTDAGTPLVRTGGTIVAQATTSASAASQIMESDGTGAGLTTLVPSTSASRTPALSSDGSQLAFSSPRAINNGGTAADDLFTAGVSSANIFGTTMAKVMRTDSISEKDPIWEHTRSSLVYSTDASGPSPHLGVVDTTTGTPTALTPNGSGDSHPSLSADDLTLVWQRGTAAAAELYSGTFNPATSTLTGITRLTNNSLTDSDPAISPDGKTIAWTQGSQVRVQPFGGSALTGSAVTLSGLDSSYTPAWSPDGSALVVGGVSGAVHDLFTFNPATGARLAGPLYGGQFFDVRAPSWADNLSVIPQSSRIAASPLSVPLSSLTQNGASPSVTGCANPSDCGNVNSAPPITIGGFGLPPITIGGFGLPAVNVGKLPPITIGGFGLPPITIGGFGLAGLSDAADLGTNPLFRDGLRKISLDSTPVSGGWGQYLVGTAFENTPLQSVSLLDVMSLHPVPAVKISDLDLTRSPLGRMSLVSVLLGDTRLDDITLHGTDTFCDDLTTYLRSLGNPASCDTYGKRASNGSIVTGGLGQASLLSLEVAGIPVDAFPGLSDLTLGDIDLPAHYGILAALPLSSLDLLHSALGNLLVKNLPADPQDSAQKIAVDCTIAGIDCSPNSAQTLYGAASAASRADKPSPFRSGSDLVALGHAADSLTLLQVIMGIAQDQVGDPLDAATLEQLGATSGALGAGYSSTGFTVRYATVGAFSLVNPVHVSVTLPAGFAYLRSSSTLTTSGGPAGIAEPTINGQLLTWNIGGVVSPTFSLSFGAASPPNLGSYSVPTATVTTPDVTQTVTGGSAPVAVVPYDASDQSTLTTPMPIAADQLYLGYLPTAGKTLYYSVPAPAIAGSTMDVYLDHLPIDADLVVYHPENVQGTTPLRPIPTDGAGPVNATADQTLALASQAESLTRESLDDYPVAPLPLAGVSDNRGLAFEHVGVLTYRGGGGAHYTIQVTGHGSDTSNKPFALRVTVTPPNGLPDVARRPFPNAGVAGATPAAPATPVQTLILINQKRMQQVYGTSRAATALSALDRLTSVSSLHALVAPVEAWSDVQDAYDAWDAHPGEPELANDIVRLINQHVDALLGTQRSALRHIVVAGTDEIVPMARLADQTQSANERGFSGEVGALTASATDGNNALLSSAAAGYVLSDDPYSSFAPRALLGSFFYPPNVAIGRLVETPEDMDGVVSQFLAPTQSGDAPGILHPSSGLATGYDFFADMADAIKSSLETTLGTTVPALLNNTWSRADLRAAYSQSVPVPDIASVNGHATPTRLVPANQLTSFGSDELSNADLAKKVLFTLGCHSGFSITDYLANGGTEDFPQVTGSRAIAAYVGQTGYGLGSAPGTVAFGEKLLVNFAHNLSGRTLGQALAQAKLDYLSRSPNVYDAKVLAEAAFYGLPMFSIGGAPSGTQVTPPTVTTDPTTGLDAVGLTLDNPIGQGDSWRLQSKPEGNYYTLVGQPQGNDGNVAIEQHRPVQPRVDLDVSEQGLLARGVLVTSLTSADQNGFDPVLVRPTVDSSAKESEQQVASVTWPLVPQDLGTVPTLAGGVKQTASFTLGRFRANGIATSGPSAGKTVGYQRRFTHLGASVLYSPTSPQPPAGATTRPRFAAFTATASGSGTSFTATPVSDAGNTIKRVLVLAHINNVDGPWTAVELTAQPDGTWTGASSLDGSRLEYLIQAVDGQGNVGITADTGAADTDGTDPGPDATTTQVSVASTPLGHDSTVSVVVGPVGQTGTPTGTVSVSDGTSACTVTLVQAAGSCALTRTSVGDFTVTASYSGDLGFLASSGSTTGTVTPAPLVITASSSSSVYGNTPQVTPSYSGFVGSDSASSLTAAPSCSTTATTSSPVGSYAATCSGAASPRYTISYQNGTVTVTKATLLVTGPSPARTYGANNPTLNPTYSGFIAGDGPSVIATPPSCDTPGVVGSAVGSYPVTCSGGSSTNYAFSYVAGALTITPASLTVTASSASRAYQADNPDITAAYDGFVNGEDVGALTTAPTCSTTAVASSPVGTYPTSCTGAQVPNYTVTEQGGTLTVTKAATTLTQTAVSVLGSLSTGTVRYSAVLRSQVTNAGISGQTVVFTASEPNLGAAGCSAVTNSAGAATCTTGFADIFTITASRGTDASYAGNGNFLGSTNRTASAI